MMPLSRNCIGAAGLSPRLLSAVRIAASVMSCVLGTSIGTAAGQDLRLVDAAAEQNLQTVRALVAQGIDVNTARADGATALLWVAHWDDPDTAAVLLGAGANVNAADDHGVTPLERAAENASVTMVRTLLAAGANPNDAQTSGLTPLMTAARTGSLVVVEALVAHGAEVNAATTAMRSTALMWAVSESHLEIVRRLLGHGADPRASTAHGFTPLLLAAADGDIAMADMLLAAGVDVNETDGTHVLPYAIVNRQDAFALFLLEHGADPNGSMGGVRALHAAAGSGRGLATRLVETAWRRPVVSSRRNRPSRAPPRSSCAAGRRPPRARRPAGRTYHDLRDVHELYRLPDQRGI